MWSILSPLFSLVIGAVPGVIREIAQARVDLSNAETEKEKVAANERIKALEAKRDVFIKESNTPWNNVSKFVLLSPFAIYFAWVILHDKIVCKWYTPRIDVGWYCTTDPLSPWLLGIAGLIYTAYFFGDATRLLKR